MIFDNEILRFSRCKHAQMRLNMVSYQTSDDVNDIADVDNCTNYRGHPSQDGCELKQAIQSALNNQGGHPSQDGCELKRARGDSDAGAARSPVARRV